jgi:Leucine-rich repeat (LRR) protein
MLFLQPGDLLEYTFGFLEQDDVFDLRLVCGRFKKHATLRVLYKLKITESNKYLLDLNPKVFKNLKVLDCSRNYLTEIPCIEGLKELRCSRNQLTEIPHIEELTVLNCSSNQLTKIPHIKGLRLLYCSDNRRLTEIPHIEGLTRLSCTWNRLTKIPCIEGLKVLWCKNNQLKEIPYIKGCRIHS